MRSPEAPIIKQPAYLGVVGDQPRLRGPRRCELDGCRPAIAIRALWVRVGLDAPAETVTGMWSRPPRSKDIIYKELYTKLVVFWVIDKRRPMTVASERVRRMPRAERRAQIVDAASRAFARAGFAKTSLDAIAAEAAVTPVILYRHFDSKADLYRAVLDRAHTQLREATGPDDFRRSQHFRASSRSSRQPGRIPSAVPLCRPRS